jgi:fibronectin type 3 domain-containing protein
MQMSITRKSFFGLLVVIVSFLFINGCTRCDGGKPKDATPPTTPTGISITAVSQTEVKISWKPSADNVGVKGYRIYRNTAQYKTTNETSFSDTGLVLKTKYCYRISAYDAVGNESAQSADVCVIP